MVGRGVVRGGLVPVGADSGVPSIQRTDTGDPLSGLLTVNGPQARGLIHQPDCAGSDLAQGRQCQRPAIDCYEAITTFRGCLDVCHAF